MDNVNKYTVSFLDVTPKKFLYKIRHFLAVWRQILIFLPKFMKMYQYHSPPPSGILEEYIPLKQQKIMSTSKINSTPRRWWGTIPVIIKTFPQIYTQLKAYPVKLTNSFQIHHNLEDFTLIFNG